jgi:hypothetical protein
MASSELLDLNGGVGLTSGEVASAQGLYVVDASGNSRFVSFANLKTAINTDPTVVPASEPLIGARALLTGTVTPPNTSENAIAWQSVSTTGFDTNSFWSAGAPTRFTIPAGVTKVMLFAGLRATGGSAVSISLAIRKGGTTQIATNSMDSGFVNQTLTSASGPLIVAAGDYFEATYVFSSVTSKAIQNEERTFFSIVALEASI